MHSFACLDTVVHMWDMTHSHVWDMTHADSSGFQCAACVTSLIHMYDMTHSYE